MQLRETKRLALDGFQLLEIDLPVLLSGRVLLLPVQPGKGFGQCVQPNIGLHYDTVYKCFKMCRHPGDGGRIKQIAVVS